ncbi:MAG: hypothetical protein FWE88_05860 [Phycisphaerae bacterium]|nr:hypothetical protein [Phycisphaerae bacterium]
MTTVNSNPPDTAVPREKSLLSHVMGCRRFLAMAGVLAVLSIGWYVMVWALGAALDKKAIPWPTGTADRAGVEVDREFMMTSFPDRLPVVAPRYMLASALTPDIAKRLGFPTIPKPEEAMQRMPEEARLVLGVGRPIDAARYADRASNWYMTRQYVDIHDRSVWQLDLTYYTGATDTVAHVPGRCMVAAGATPLNDQTKTLVWDLPKNALGWETITVIRSVFQTTDETGRQSNVVQYYTFSLNGDNEADWKMIRIGLTTDIRRKYVYFGKIQFAPRMMHVGELSAVDEAAKLFFRAAAPELLATFPSADTVRQLNESSNKPSASP